MSRRYAVCSAATSPPRQYAVENGWNGQPGRSRRQLAAESGTANGLSIQWNIRRYSLWAGSPQEQASCLFHPKPIEWIRSESSTNHPGFQHLILIGCLPGSFAKATPVSRNVSPNSSACSLRPKTPCTERRPLWVWWHRIISLHPSKTGEPGQSSTCHAGATRLRLYQVGGAACFQECRVVGWRLGFPARSATRNSPVRRSWSRLRRS